MEWYRKSTWSETDEAEFYEKLSKARKYNRAEYIKIQASTLINTENAKLLNDAEILLNKIIDEYPNEKSEMSSTLNALGRIYQIRNNFDKAIGYFRESLNFEKLYPNVITNSYLNFSELIVKNQKKEDYDYVQILLLKEVPESLFPVVKYKGYSLLSIINANNGNFQKAKEYEKLAEENANATTTNLRYHKYLGIVKKRDSWLDKLLKLK